MHFSYHISVLDVLRLSSGYNSGLQNLIKNICIINTPYGNKATEMS